MYELGQSLLFDNDRSLHAHTHTNERELTVFSSLKGQSAIEYLMTYGWMLLVVAIVGGAIFSIAQTQSVESSSGFSGSDIAVENFGLSSSNSLDMVLRNSAGDTVEVQSITLSQGGEEVVTDVREEISVGDSSSVSTLGVVDSDAAGTVDVEVSYDVGGLTDQVVRGTVSGGLEVDPQGAAPNSNWAFVDVSEVDQNTVDTSDMGDFYIMRYEASAASNVSEPPTSATPVSVEGHIPWTQISQNDAVQVCQDAGYRLPSNRQWQAATMAVIGDSSTQPLGNNDDGSAVEDGSSGTLSGYRKTTLTGSGPSSWSNSLGIADLNGNVWEWTSTVVDQSNPMHFGGTNNHISSWNDNGYPESLGSSNSSLGDDYYWSSSNDNRAGRRGGGWVFGARAGVFSMAVNDAPSASRAGIGFRCSLS